VGVRGGGGGGGARGGGGGGGGGGYVVHQLGRPDRSQERGLRDAPREGLPERGGKREPGGRESDTPRESRRGGFLPDGGELSEHGLRPLDRIRPQVGGEQGLHPGVGEDHRNVVEGRRREQPGRRQGEVAGGRRADDRRVAPQDHGGAGRRQLVQRCLVERAAGRANGRDVRTMPEDRTEDLIAERDLLGHIPGQAAAEERGEARGRVRIGGDLDHVRPHHRLERLQHRGRVGRRSLAGGNAPASLDREPIRHLSELVEEAGGERQVHRRRIRSRREDGERVDLGTQVAARRQTRRQAPVDELAVGSDRRRRSEVERP
jgi:hypothetical protein